jgi:membrane protein YdbS with pleckstrin-like domain
MITMTVYIKRYNIIEIMGKGNIISFILSVACALLMFLVIIQPYFVNLHVVLVILFGGIFYLSIFFLLRYKLFVKLLRFDFVR